MCFYCNGNHATPLAGALLVFKDTATSRLLVEVQRTSLAVGLRKVSGSERRTLRNFAQRDLAPLFLFLRLLRVLQPLEALLDLDCPRGCSSL